MIKFSKIIKYTNNELRIIIKKLGFDLLTIEQRKIKEKIDIRDDLGYLYYPQIHHLLNGHPPERFSKSNPYTIHNIKLWCKLNNKPFELVSDIYNGNDKNLKWKCLKEECGEEFNMCWGSISQNRGCPYCVGLKVGIKNCLAIKKPDLINEWHPILNGDLTPWNVTYASHKYIWWQCSKCGHEWPAIIKNRTINNSNCPKCNISKGELIILKYLEFYNIFYRHQFWFDNCRNILPLPFDFVIFKDINKTKILMLIEYDGEFHYKPARYSKDKNKMLVKLKYQQENDNIKNIYCKNNNIPLLRIPYWEFKNIETILEEEISTMCKSTRIIATNKNCVCSL